jgi:sulfide dehydrogenase cytochrome subunit
MKLLKLAMLSGGLVLSTSLWAAPQTPAMIANACGGCHGTNGSSAGPSMPTIAGQPAVTTVEAMKQFKSGERPSTVMGRLAKGYSDADFEAMGKFFEDQKFTRAANKTDAKMVKKGEELHNKNCKRCHLENGKEFDEKANILAGQWLTYLGIQMDDYHSGKRKMFDKKEEKMKPLSKEDLHALAHFYASQK